MEVEQQISRALMMIDEAETMARALNVDFVELEWARSHALRWNGDLERALAPMSLGRRIGPVARGTLARSRMPDLACDDRS